VCATSTTSDGGQLGSFDFVVVANRLPVDRVELTDGSFEYRPSPGGLVTALRPVMRSVDGAWVGWSGSPGVAERPCDVEGMHLVSVGLSSEEVEDYYEGFANSTLWPLYHDVIVPPEFHRHWWDVYVRVNQRFARTAAEQAAADATVWVHDYQLQLVPGMLRRRRPDLRIGFFNHIPFPGYEIFAQLPWRRRIVEGLLGADLIGFQRQQDASNFLRACRRAANLLTRGTLIRVPPTADPAPSGAGTDARDGRDGSDGRDGTDARDVRAAAFPISIDFCELDTLSRQPSIRARALEIREALGRPEALILGVDRLDYTKGIRHRLEAYGELLDEGRLGPPKTVLVQVASPSRERVEHYQSLRDEVEGTVGRINGDHSTVGQPAVHYLHQSFPREEMIAMYVAADVMLVTPLRDGMNLVAKEYVACRSDERGRLVLSEFTGAAEELGGAFVVNPHDIEGMKETLLHAIRVSDRDAQRRMRAMRRRVRDYDVNKWASSFLGALHMVRPAATIDDVSL
jgi:alpha,alpha-trehalose-phosphate synthase [UDP-forming]